MPTSREAFQAWHDDVARRGMTPWDFWQAAYRAGQESMREECEALVADQQLHEGDEDQMTVNPVLHRILNNMRALPIDDE